MTDRERNEPSRTTPSQAPGEAGDEEARREAERAERGPERGPEDELADGEPGEAADALSPSPGAQRRSGDHARGGDGGRQR
ncbi:hypothetical protein [Streptomyces sp. A1136]|uniref:hypothetical protein n=1 Tax=Streptomyces sp. A1136 TaxID=2563102 RepID=UPI00109E8570|nr:hypothetical protein [Streptomyces sp. A1136]THA49829.1 hypothetical protein E6R62_27185 [Streptomyces sp. A1136]